MSSLFLSYNVQVYFLMRSRFSGLFSVWAAHLLRVSAGIRAHFVIRNVPFEINFV